LSFFRHAALAAAVTTVTSLSQKGPRVTPGSRFASRSGLRRYGT
jgi:hypothetical protein